MIFHDIMMKISDQGDVLISKAIHHVGVIVGIGGGAATYTAGKAIDATQISPTAAFVLEWGGLISMVAAATLIIKNIVDGVVLALKAKWDREEQLKRMSERIEK